MVQAVEETKQGGSKKVDQLKQMEEAMRQRAAEEKAYETNATEGYENMSFEEAQAGKFFCNFPFPYMNGFLHLGHAYSLSKCEFRVRYEKQMGKNAIFPFAFHCTGMPIQAAANRLKKEIESGNIHSVQPTEAEIAAAKKAKKEIERPPLTQYEVLIQNGIPEAEIPNFVDSNFWLDYFPPRGKTTLQKLGIFTDWRRSFITTERNPYFDKFVEWQYHHMKNKGKVKFGKRYTVFSELDGQPCADHDRSKGEGVMAQEYTGIKIKLIDFPESLAAFKDKNVFLVAATLRPETMYGQTNCFMLPEGNYGLYEMVNGDIFVISKRAARGMSHQDLTKEDRKYPELLSVKGADFIGMRVKAPMTKYEHVYVLPLPSIKMDKGTGVVTSVPSDAPTDFAMMRDLQTKEGLRERMGIKEEWVKGFDPLPIIRCPTLGDVCAATAVEEFKIASHKDLDLIEKAKDKCYLEGFDHGVMLVGMCEGKPVKECKEEVKKYMIAEGMAVPYWEPQSEVISRSDDSCIVAACDQWFLEYGEDQWKEETKAYVASESFETYNPKCKKEFMETLDWLREWACSRTQGLGTQIPWDKQFVIESLSDSTIYMAFYSASHFLQGSLDGSEMGPSKIPAEAMNVAAWDYIFFGTPFDADACPGLTEDQLKPMRYEFNYWYPMDMRVSGKDLIRNHLCFSLYSHQAMWGPEKMPKSMFCNGYLMLNGQKMSKSTGNFMTIDQCMEKFGTDATRMALADAGDSLDDANFDEQVANAAILKLVALEHWIEENLPKEGFDFSTVDESSLTGWDKIVINECRKASKEAKQNYSGMKLKMVMVQFNKFITLKEAYAIATEHKTCPSVIYKYIKTILTFMNPIVPHFCENVWTKHVIPAIAKTQNVPHQLNERLMSNGWIQFDSEEIDHDLSASLTYLEKSKKNFRTAFDKAASGGGKKKKKGPAEPEAPKENCAVFIGTEFPEFQVKVLEVLQSCTFEDNKIVNNEHIAKVREAIPDKKQQGLAMKFAAFTLDEVAEVGQAAMQLRVPFSESDLIEENKKFLFDSMPSVKNIKVITVSDAEAVADIPNAAPIAASAVPGKPACMFF